MLPARHRLRTNADFVAVFRGARGAGGSRSGSRLIVVHANSTDARADEPPRVGLVVSKAVGNAVARNRTKRVLRALMSAQIGRVPSGVDVVIRANPGVRAVPTSILARDLDRLLDVVLRRLRTQSGR